MISLMSTLWRDEYFLRPQVGLFCSRAPHRPNPIALSALKISSVDVKSGIIEVVGLDLLDGTPVLDIKPYVPAFDSFPGGFSICLIAQIMCG